MPFMIFRNTATSSGSFQKIKNYIKGERKMTKRRLVRDMWLKIRKKNNKGEYEPSWVDFKKDYITENPVKKEETING